MTPIQFCYIFAIMGIAVAIKSLSEGDKLAVAFNATIFIVSVVYLLIV